MSDEEGEDTLDTKRLKKPEERKKKWILLLAGIIMVIIGIVGLVLKSFFADKNEIISAGFFGFGLSLIILGSIVLVIAIWKIAHIEYGF